MFIVIQSEWMMNLDAPKIWVIAWKGEEETEVLYTDKV